MILDMGKDMKDIQMGINMKEPLIKVSSINKPFKGEHQEEDYMCGKMEKFMMENGSMG